MNTLSRYFLFGLLVCVCSSGWACVVPLYRYSLDKWEPDVFPALVVYRTSLMADEEALLAALPGDRMRVMLVDLETEADSYSQAAPYLNAIQSLDLENGCPKLVLFAPGGSEKKRMLFAETLTPRLINRLMQSPLRESMERELREGATNFALFIPSPDDRANESARGYLEGRLAQYESNQLLPNSLIAGLSSEEQVAARMRLKMDFTLIDLDLQDPAELVSAAQVEVASGGDIPASILPAVVLTYGPARFLDFISLNTADRDARLDAAVAFLAQESRCCAKADSPGFDMFTTIGFDEIITEDISAMFADVSAVMGNDDGRNPGSFRMGAKSGEASEVSRRSGPPWLIFLAVGVFGVAFILLVRRRKGLST